jgi:hypothetical protein
MLQVNVSNVSCVFDVCLKCFYLDVSKVDLVLHVLQWLYTHVSSVSSVFRRMLHIFHLDVSKVDRVLHMLQWRQWLVESGLS